MVLFSGLLGISKDPETATTSPSSSSIPTVLQLYTSPRAELALFPPEGSPHSKVAKHAVLSYQAIELDFPNVDYDVDNNSKEDDDEALFGKKPQRNVLRSTQPNLGIWHCLVDQPLGGQRHPGNAPSLVERLLPAMLPSKSFPICFTVDLTDPSQVEPCISRLQQTLVRYLVYSDDNDDSAAQDKKELKHATAAVTSVAPKVATTSLRQLQATTFGQAPNDNTVIAKKPASEMDDGADAIRVCLVIAALVPRTRRGFSMSHPQSTTDQMEDATSVYRQQQAQALVLYHLRRYAAALNAILVFVQADSNRKSASRNESANVDTGAASGAEKDATQVHTDWHTVSVSDLQKLLQGLANGKEVWNTSPVEDQGPTEANDDTNDAQVESSTTSPVEAPTAIYGPGNHHEELIETLLLRNAHCPGLWDAAKDSLWVALPANDPDNNNNNAADDLAIVESNSLTKPLDGDDAWLADLRDSLAADLPGATAASTASPLAEASTAAVKSPGQDTAVSSFFESLLK